MEAAAGARSVQIEFPHYAAGLLESLNRHRLEGKFCDLSVHVQGRVFQAHKSVLAAASPYFHDKLLLRDAGRLVLPGAIEPEAFENLLQLIYSGRLRLMLDALPGHLLAASGLQMWQVVDQCSGVLKELEAAGGPLAYARGPWTARAAAAAATESPSSSSGSHRPGLREDGGGGSARRPHRLDEEEEEEAQICSSGSAERLVKVVLDEEEEEEVVAEEEGRRGRACPGKGSREPGPAFASPHEAPKVFFIKQERFDPEEAPSSALGGGPASCLSEAGFLKSPGGASEVPGLCQPEIQAGEPLGYLSLPGGASAALSADSVAAFPESSWKPVDLHGNEILGHTVHGQVVHAPVKLMSAPDGKKFGCLCGKRFAVKPKRDRHIMLTFSLRPFGCSVCPKKFKLKHHLTEHMKTHDGNLHTCQDCGRKFRVQSCFLKHKELCKGQGWATACWTYK
ncbi:zinc finger and BTB domain-containing protein 9-like isoform X2 [Pseudonaja textilis]|uniref:zinc finger and BTB domain-containing protein 9-like isoform X2 n=1 Tax=Pseudonaja textilis TaxID=8673 RepID=UPI000EAA8586|nr:zinc finger and BTB domain-containing protein 9-like isoform X2 [Pseudonaja textilis]